MQLVDKIFPCDRGCCASLTPAVNIQRFIDKRQALCRHHHMVVPFVVFAYDTLFEPDFILHQEASADDFAPCAVVICIFIDEITIDISDRPPFGRNTIVETAWCDMSVRFEPFLKFVVNNIRIPGCLVCEKLKHVVVCQEVIAVYIANVIALSCFKADVPSVSLASIRFMYCSDAGILLGIFITNLRSGVSGAIIHENDFKILIGLLQDTINTRANIFFNVIAGKYNAKFHSVQFLYMFRYIDQY